MLKVVILNMTRINMLFYFLLISSASAFNFSVLNNETFGGIFANFSANLSHLNLGTFLEDQDFGVRLDLYCESDTRIVSHDVNLCIGKTYTEGPFCNNFRDSFTLVKCYKHLIGGSFEYIKTFNFSRSINGSYLRNCSIALHYDFLHAACSVQSGLSRSEFLVDGEYIKYTLYSDDVEVTPFTFPGTRICNYYIQSNCVTGGFNSVSGTTGVFDRDLGFCYTGHIQAVSQYNRVFTCDTFGCYNAPIGSSAQSCRYSVSCLKYQTIIKPVRDMCFNSSTFMGLGNRATRPITSLPYLFCTGGFFSLLSTYYTMYQTRLYVGSGDTHVISGTGDPILRTDIAIFCRDSFRNCVAGIGGLPRNAFKNTPSYPMQYIPGHPEFYDVNHYTWPMVCPGFLAVGDVLDHSPTNIPYYDYVGKFLGIGGNYATDALSSFPVLYIGYLGTEYGLRVLYPGINVTNFNSSFTHCFGVNGTDNFCLFSFDSNFCNGRPATYCSTILYSNVTSLNFTFKNQLNNTLPYYVNVTVLETRNITINNTCFNHTIFETCFNYTEYVDRTEYIYVNVTEFVNNTEYITEFVPKYVNVTEFVVVNNTVFVDRNVTDYIYINNTRWLVQNCTNHTLIVYNDTFCSNCSLYLNESGCVLDNYFELGPGKMSVFSVGLVSVIVMLAILILLCISCICYNMFKENEIDYDLSKKYP
uniref:Putative glycoprotein n=1 Tax=Guangdong chinese water skink coronavirus TaxID=2116470 RepID=A0A2P1GNJ4_9NIDO|nr:putative glycoprotein [Guangdong chinese water skink coronavirus]